MAMSHKAYQQYRNASAMTASPERLLVMLYDGLIRFMRQAKQAIEDNQLQDAHTHLVNSQEIIVQLQNSLQMEYEISHALASLYDYYYRRLIDANVDKSIEPIDEILPRIEELREAWVQASIKVKEEQSEEPQQFQS